MSTFPFYFVEIREVDVWIVFIEMYNDNSCILSSYIYDIDVCVLFDEIYAVKRNYYIFAWVIITVRYHMLLYITLFYQQFSTAGIFLLHCTILITVIKDKVNK